MLFVFLSVLASQQAPSNSVIITGTQMSVIGMRKVTVEDIDRALKEANLQRSDITELIIEGVENIGDGCFKGFSKIPKVSFPSTLKFLGKEAFWGCETFEFIYIPAKVKDLGDGCFSGCTASRMLIFEGGAITETIGNNCFSNNPGVTLITLPASVVKIGDHAFMDCSATRIVVPSSVKTIGVQAFAMKTLKEIVVESGNAQYECDYQGVLYTKADHTLIAAPADIEGNLIVPMACEAINSNAFTYCKAAKVTINGGVTTIQENAFAYSCITEIIFDASCTSVPAGCFNNQENLKTFTFNPGSKVASIGIKAFSNCPALEAINIEELPELTTIGSRCFENCKKLGTVTFPPSTKNIDDFIFDQCSSIKTIKILASKVTFKNDAFTNMEALSLFQYNGKEEVSSQYKLFNNSPQLKSVQVPKDYQGTTFAELPVEKVLGNMLKQTKYHKKMTKPALYGIIAAGSCLIVFAVIIAVVAIKKNGQQVDDEISTVPMLDSEEAQ